MLRRLMGGHVGKVNQGPVVLLAKECDCEVAKDHAGKGLESEFW